jgi:hypothetical protein
MLNRRAADAALYIIIMDGPILLSEFQNFANIFSEKGAVSLSTNISMTYTIELIKKGEIFYGSIYSLSEKNF